MEESYRQSSRRAMAVDGGELWWRRTEESYGGDRGGQMREEGKMGFWVWALAISIFCFLFLFFFSQVRVYTFFHCISSSHAQDELPAQWGSWGSCLSGDSEIQPNGVSDPIPANVFEFSLRGHGAVALHI
ncbi:hypothetical protein ACSBR2_012658 [Camellia fascicularis]